MPGPGGTLPGPGSAPPMMPKSPMGGPQGPGGGPMTSPGQGAGQALKSDTLIMKAVIPGLQVSLNSYPAGSKKHKAIMDAVRALAMTFGEDEGGVTETGIRGLAQAAKARGGRPAPGFAPPGMQPPAAAGGGMPPMPPGMGAGGGMPGGGGQVGG